MDLPRPGLLGILIRLTLGVLVLFMGYGAIVDAPSFWDGYTDPLGSLGYLVPLALFSSWVVNELVQKSWGWKPLGALLAGLGVAVGLGAVQGDAFGPAFGTYVWTWALGFSLLLGPAHLLAAALRTPGCEMRSYAHLRAKLAGGDVGATVCPGWIDRADGIRLFGKW
ncbi:MAG: hypothetical protein ACPHID_01870 [Thermoplasmatota archaeon]